MAEYHVENFGCRASQADGEAIAAHLDRFGLARSGSAQDAEVVVVNTCSVTAQAERSARAFVRRIVRDNPKARILLTGCYAQRAPAEAAALPGVTAVVGNSHKALAAPLAVAALRSGEPWAAAQLLPLTALRDAQGAPVLAAPSASAPILADERFAHADVAAFDLGAGAGTRPNLKVQDGCAHRCSFCIIPTTRGPSRSLPLPEILARVRRFVASGGAELVLSGINLGRWGRDLDPPARFEDLVAAILRQTALPRLRISSIEPMDWSPALLALFDEFARDDGGPSGPRLARHAHLPLQSGADALLRTMHRRYRPWHYEDKLAAIRERMPEAAIGADVMVGFPGETDALFEESFRFIARQPFTYLHLFPFSPRPGTPGWQMHRRAPVPPQAVEERLQRLRAWIAERNRAFRARFLGRNLAIVTLRRPESAAQTGITPAVSDNFIKIALQASVPSNRMLRAYIPSMSGDGLTGAPRQTGSPAAKMI